MAKWDNIVIGIINVASQFPIERLINRNREKEFDDFQHKAKDRYATAPSAPRTIPAPQTQPEITTESNIASACVPCSLGHFSTSAGLLNEAVRFKDEGITSNEILDRIAKTLEEQNTLERVDLAPEKLQQTSGWEREIADEALQQSRKLRHRLEGIQTIEELEDAAADTASYYRTMNREWYKGRLAHMRGGQGEAEG